MADVCEDKNHYFLNILFTSFQKIKRYSPGKPTFFRKNIPLKMIFFQTIMFAMYTCMPLKAQDCNNNCLLDLSKILSKIMGPLRGVNSQI